MTLRQILVTGLLALLVTSCKTTGVTHGETAQIFDQEIERQFLSAYLAGDTAKIREMAGGALFDRHPLGDLKSDYPQSTGKFTGYNLVSQSRGTFQTSQMTSAAPMIVRTFALKSENYRTLFIRFYLGVDNGVNRLMKLEPDLNLIK